MLLLIKYILCNNINDTGRLVCINAGFAGVAFLGQTFCSSPDIHALGSTCAVQDHKLLHVEPLRTIYCTYCTLYPAYIAYYTLQNVIIE